MKRTNTFRQMKNIAIVLIAALSIVGCKGKAEKQAEEDEEIITRYIADHNLDAIETGSGLYVVIENEGSGLNPTIYDEVSVFYKGYLTDQSVFDQTDTVPATFPLNAVIEGWQQGIPYFKPGGNGILLIPSALGYGDSEAGSIPANSVLIFDVELVDVN